jgi:hypothetical protein
MDYKYKYLKYKNKYLVLKSLGGSTAVVGKNPKVGDIVESIDGSEYWGIISKEQKTVWVLNTGRVAQKLNMGSKWQIRDIVLNNKPLIYPLGGAKVGKKVEGIESGDIWGTIVREEERRWVLDKRGVKKKTMGITWKIKDEPLSKPFLAKSIVQYIINAHGGQLTDTEGIIKERGILYNLYGCSHQKMRSVYAEIVKDSILDPNRKNLIPAVQYNHNFRAKYKDFLLACDYDRRSGPCFTGKSGTQKSIVKASITRVGHGEFKQEVWSLDTPKLKEDYPMLSVNPQLSQLLNLIIIPDFLTLTNSGSLEDAINKGCVCSLHCLFCYAPTHK